MKGERFVTLDWRGPFRLVDGKLALHPLEAATLPRDVGGVYALHGLNPLLNGSSPLYIGESGRLLTTRLAEHKWLSREWRVEAYVAPLPGKPLRKDVERLLAYAHQPPSNSALVGTAPDFRKPIRIWNTGRFWGLYPEVSSQHPWNT